MVWCSMVWYGMVVWYGTARYGLPVSMRASLYQYNALILTPLSARLTLFLARSFALWPPLCNCRLFSRARSTVQRVHVFEAVSYEGEPKESEEMRPRWFQEENLPLKVPTTRTRFPCLHHLPFPSAQQ